MIRSLSMILAGATMVSGCAGPIETRGRTHQVIAAPEQKNFTISSKDAVINRDIELAREMVAKALGERGYKPSPDASIVVHVALAERPADIAITAKDKEAEQSIAAAKRKKRFQSCRDQEHRLTVSLFDQASGTKLYTGSASEYHCKGTIAQSLPFLIDSALSGFGGEATEAPQDAIRTREGIE
ncbi:hypothetical protein [Parasphingorhabdus sp.]|uniref:hypothetical protein n=1 Tax=Parasphingorhabdus sp. TaxID=2709688 RepID=UPI003A90D33A